MRKNNLAAVAPRYALTPCDVSGIQANSYGNNGGTLYEGIDCGNSSQKQSTDRIGPHLRPIAMIGQYYPRGLTSWLAGCDARTGRTRTAQFKCYPTGLCRGPALRNYYATFRSGSEMPTLLTPYRTLNKVNVQGCPSTTNGASGLEKE